ncbi:hypothetical protein J6590_071105 [Homalodisca vitripennis]|nr:hypothetical protein J6590_071105 [Homalodisca vitripennis]
MFGISPPIRINSTDPLQAEQPISAPLIGGIFELQTIEKFDTCRTPIQLCRSFRLLDVIDRIAYQLLSQGRPQGRCRGGILRN